MDTWKLRDLRDGKDYLYIVELEGNILTRRYGWEDGKLRKSTRSHDTAEDARDEADKTIEKKLKEGYELVEEPTVSAPLGSADGCDAGDPCNPVLPVSDSDGTDPSLFPIVGLMRLRDSRIKTPVLICAMPDGYRFKVMSSLPYDRSVIGGKARLAYQETAADGVPVDPVLMGVVDA